MRTARLRAPYCFEPSASPFERPRLNRVLERTAFGAGTEVFAFQPVIPFCLRVGVVDQGERGTEAQPLLLTLQDSAVLVQKGPHVVPQCGLQEPEPGQGPIDA